MSRIVRLSRIFILAAGLIVFFSACEKDEKPPKDTISEEKMAIILSEIHIAESRVTRLQLKSLDSSLLIFNKLKNDIWKKEKVDTLVYKNSYTYYMTHPQQMAHIYELVNKKIEAREKNNNLKF